MTKRSDRTDRRGSKRPRKRSAQSSSGTRRRRAFEPGEDIRLNKYIARSGVCSRRDADRLIAEGKVTVNGDAVTEMGTKVRLKDTVQVNGKRIVPEHLTWILLNKPKDTITTTSDERDRRTVLDLIDRKKVDIDGLFPVGRLDRDTTGVLLITNDGDLAHRLMHPSFEITKMYVVTADRPIEDADLDRLRSGIELEDGPAAADRIVRPDPSNPTVIGLSIHEGRNRQVRRMIEALGYDVRSLERVRYANLSTKGVRRGKWRRLDPDEVSALYRQVKL
ncbi:MAG: rRNA pseudouridine synthase [Rhodothermales bacterium]|nr:rRNA pseudouridine synthase [Rhodothermales bacterium]